MNKVVAVIQARMGSKRLPNKMMLHLNGYPIVEWAWRRISKCREVNEVVVAIPLSTNNLPLYSHLIHIGANVIYGSEEDVLGRVYKAAWSYEADYVVRVCADNPFVSWTVVDDLVREYKESNLDYAYNHIPIGNTYPNGLGAEIVCIDLLRDLNHPGFDTLSKEQHEHIFNYVWDNWQNFRMGVLGISGILSMCRRIYPWMRLDIDTMGDYQKAIESGVTIDMDALEVVKAYANIRRI